MPRTQDDEKLNFEEDLLNLKVFNIPIPARSITYIEKLHKENEELIEENNRLNDMLDGDDD